MKPKFVAAVEWLCIAGLNWASETRQRQAYYDRVAAVPAVKRPKVTAADHLRIEEARKEVTEQIWLLHARDAVCVELQLTPDQVAGILAAQTKRRNGDTDLPPRRTTTRTASAVEPTPAEDVDDQALDASADDAGGDDDSEASADDAGSPPAEEAPADSQQETEAAAPQEPLEEATDEDTAPPLVDLDKITLDPKTWPRRAPTADGDPKRPPTASTKEVKPADVDEIDRDITFMCARDHKDDKPRWKATVTQIGIIRRLSKYQVAGILAVGTRTKDPRIVGEQAA